MSDEDVTTAPKFESLDRNEYTNKRSQAKQEQKIEPIKNVEDIDMNWSSYDYSSKDKKIVAFVGTSKNGTSFIVNNIAQLLSEKGIKTTILD